MRITQQQVVASGLAGVQNAETAAASLERQVSTGQRISQPSDDPAGAGRLVRLDAALAQVSQAQKNGQTAQTDLQTEDAAYQQLSNVLSQANELAVEGANGTLTPSDLAALKTQADGLLQQAVSIANTQSDGRYVFGGTDTQTAPYSTSSQNGITSVTYSGSTNPRTVPVGGTEITTGVPGPAPFASSNGTQGALDAIAALRDALANGGGTSAVSQTISGIQAAQTQASVATAQVGSSLQSVQQVLDALDSQSTQLTTIRSDVGDTDLASTITKLEQQQQVYQQGLAVLAQVMHVSILNYLAPPSG